MAKDVELENDSDIKVNLILPAAFPPGLLQVSDAAVQDAIDNVLTQAKISPLVALLVHELCPARGEAIQVGGGRHSRIVLATTEGWQDSVDAPTPEGILEHWDEVVADRDQRSAAGSMSDLLARRGLPDYGVMELVQWTATGENPRIKR